LSPWWLRPTSEGAENADKQDDRREQESTSQPAGAADSAPAPAADPHTSAPLVATASVPSAAASPVAPEAAPGAREPYRSFWPPRTEPVGQAEPASQGADAAAPETVAPERSEAGGDAPGPSSPRPALRPVAPLSPLPSAAAAAPLAPMLPLLPLAEVAPREPAAEASAADLLEGDAEAEGESEERDEESRGEGRKKRSRRGRGGRRKNGRTASGAAGGAEAAEEEDDETAIEELAAAAVPTPAPAPWQPGRSGRSGETYVISASDLEPMSREIVISVPDRQRPQHEERKIAVFCDFENIALGVRDSEISKLDIGLILERLLEKGKIIVKKAYADWERYSDYKRPFHEAAIELIDIPQKFYSGKNSADIKMVVDAMDLSYAKEHLDTFVILSGDSDFSPLVSKLKENNKYVIGIGVKNSSSNLLVDNCDEFIYYEDIWRDAQKGPRLDGLNKKTAEAFSLLVESIQALVRENKDVLWGSMIKQTMQRKKPSFNEGYYGYSTFSELLEDAERKSIIKLKKDQRSGTYIVTGFAKSSDAGPGRRQV
jgi:uncharacterized protein (TIGR00288 family)